MFIQNIVCLFFTQSSQGKYISWRSLRVFFFASWRGTFFILRKARKVVLVVSIVFHFTQRAQEVSV